MCSFPSVCMSTAQDSDTAIFSLLTVSDSSSVSSIVAMRSDCLIIFNPVQTLPSSSFLNAEAIACQLSAACSDTAADLGKARAKAQAALRTMDKNQDGVVDATEFIGEGSSNLIVDAMEFIRYDTNLDGVLDEQVCISSHHRQNCMHTRLAH